MSDSLAFSSLTASEKGKLRSELLWELSRMIQRYNGGTGEVNQSPDWRDTLGCTYGGDMFWPLKIIFPSSRPTLE